jgi:rod shape-determining protein MreB and related proteins
MSHLAVDLGTSNLRVWGAAGELFREPSVVTSERVRRRWRRGTRRAGHDALEVARNTGAKLVRPLRSAGIADFKAAEVLLRSGFAAGRRPLAFKRPDTLFTIPPVTPEIQQRALRRLALDSGARSVALVPTSIAVLAGIGVDVTAPAGHMVIEIGGGTTQMAVVALSSIICSRSLAVGGDDMDRAIDEFVQRRFNMTIGEGLAEQLRIEVGAARRGVDVDPLRIEGNDLTTGQSRAVEVHSAEVFGAISPLLEEIFDAARALLAVTPPELAADVADGGIALSGGASQLRELDSVLARVTGVGVVCVEDPLGAPARGCARLLSDAKPLVDVVIP